MMKKHTLKIDSAMEWRFAAVAKGVLLTVETLFLGGNMPPTFPTIGLKSKCVMLVVFCFWCL